MLERGQYQKSNRCMANGLDFSDLCLCLCMENMFSRKQRHMTQHYIQQTGNLVLSKFTFRQKPWPISKHWPALEGDGPRENGVLRL